MERTTTILLISTLIIISGILITTYPLSCHSSLPLPADIARAMKAHFATVVSNIPTIPYLKWILAAIVFLSSFGAVYQKKSASSYLCAVIFLISTVLLCGSLSTFYPNDIVDHVFGSLFSRASCDNPFIFNSYLFDLIDSRIKQLLPIKLLLPYVKFTEYMTPPYDIRAVILPIFCLIFGVLLLQRHGYRFIALFSLLMVVPWVAVCAILDHLPVMIILLSILLSIVAIILFAIVFRVLSIPISLSASILACLDIAAKAMTIYSIHPIFELIIFAFIFASSLIFVDERTMISSLFLWKAFTFIVPRYPFGIEYSLPLALILSAIFMNMNRDNTKLKAD